MRLENLIEHTTVQREMIGQHFRMVGHTCPSSLSVCDHSGSPIWKMGLEFSQKEELVERDENPIDDIHALPDSLPLTRSTVTLPEALATSSRLPDQRILVRSEYYETEQAVLSTNQRGGDVFVVAGQPGVGKSVFLLWLLLRRLALGLPTVWQIRKDYVVLFHEDGISQLDDLDDPEAYRALKFSRRAGDSHKRIWALVDMVHSSRNPRTS